jgi:xanthine/uracil/vitamin C permease (AzgA family)
MFMPSYIKRYTRRLTGFMTSYVVVLIGGQMLESSGISYEVRVFLAFLTAATICGVFWAIYRLMIECDDEYQRLLMVKTILLATGATLGITTCWQFLEMYEVVSNGPGWIGVIWLAMWGLATPIVRWRA